MLRQAQHERKIRNDFRTGPVRPEPVEGRLQVSSLHFKKETYITPSTFSSATSPGVNPNISP